MREVIVSPTVLGKLSDLVSYLRDDIKLSEEAAQAYRDMQRRDQSPSMPIQAVVQTGLPLCGIRKTLGFSLSNT